MSDTPMTDEAEEKARSEYERMREVGWPPFDSSPFEFARQLERYRMDLIRDQVDDEEKLKEMCAKSGIQQSHIDGDDVYTPGIAGLGELLYWKIQALERELNRYKMAELLKGDPNNERHT